MSREQKLVQNEEQRFAECPPHLWPRHQSADDVGTHGLEGLGVRAAARAEVHLPPGAMPSGWPGEQ